MDVSEVCRKCFRSKENTGDAICGYCQERARLSMADLYAQRTSQNVCPKCGKNPCDRGPGAYCSVCYERARIRKTAWKLSRGLRPGPRRRAGGRPRVGDL